MSPENFCYWLQGYIELSEAALNVPLPPGEDYQQVKITREQITEIKKHLSYVFKTPIIGRATDGSRATEKTALQMLAEKGGAGHMELC